MPMLSMKTKKPMLEILAITEDAGLSSPNRPSSAPTSRPSHPIHRGSARVVRMATAYSGTTTPKPRKLPAALVTRAMAAKVSAVAASVACPSRVCVEVGRHEFVAHRDRDQMRDSHQRQPDGTENRRQNHHRPSQSKGVVETHQRHDPQKPHQDDQRGATEEQHAGAIHGRDPIPARPSGLRDQHPHTTGTHRNGANHKADNRAECTYGCDRGERGSSLMGETSNFS